MGDAYGAGIIEVLSKNELQRLADDNGNDEQSKETNDVNGLAA